MLSFRNWTIGDQWFFSGPWGGKHTPSSFNPPCAMLFFFGCFSHFLYHKSNFPPFTFLEKTLLVIYTKLQIRNSVHLSCPISIWFISVYFCVRWCGVACTVFRQKVGLCCGKQKWYWRHKTACPRLWCIVLILHQLFMAGPLVIIWLYSVLSMCILCTMHDNILIICWSCVMMVLARVPKLQFSDNYVWLHLCCCYMYSCIVS